MCPEIDASAKSIDDVLGKLVCLASSRLRVVFTFLCSGHTNWASVAPLVLDRYLLWRHCHLYLVHIYMFFRCSSGVLTLMASLGSLYDLEGRQS